MRVQFYIHTFKNPNIQEIRVEINFYDKEERQISAIHQVYHIGGLMGIGGGYHYKLMYKESDDEKLCSLMQS
jgi:acetoin utilization deacetylase AcuC-like enzyme